MTARPRKTVGSLLLVLVGALAGCTSYFEIPIETPIQPKLDIAAFQRVLVAGFIAGGDEEVDANLETVRLLRSQLRQKGALRVIEPRRCRSPKSPAQQARDAGRRRDRPRRRRPPTRPQLPPIKEETDLEPYEEIFANTEYWKKIGEEHQSPLIVTGTVLFRPHTSSGFVQREQEVYDSFGRRRVVPQRIYMERKGFILRPTFVFIDGRTGETLHSETFREEILYNQNTQTPALSSFFELMDRLLPTFLNTHERAEDPRHARAAQVGRLALRRSSEVRPDRVGAVGPRLPRSREGARFRSPEAAGRQACAADAIIRSSVFQRRSHRVCNHSDIGPPVPRRAGRGHRNQRPRPATPAPS